MKNLEEILEKQIENRVNSTLKDIPSFTLLKNNVKAAKRILELLYSGKRMLIVGDYDADGIFATTILYSFLKDSGFGSFVDYFIPSRIKDGYGMSPNVVVYAKSHYFDFIVTVDNGIAAVDAIDMANKEGIEVIITDHHTAPKILPNVDIIVNPRVDGETFPYTYISGATVAWYLVAALKSELASTIDIRKYIDFVAITIISDVMPLDNINLAFLNYGIKLIKDRKRIFYNLLWNDWTAPTINETSIAFNLVPMINAIGRIDDANIGVDMFTSTDEKQIKKYFLEMKEINEKRKELSRNYVIEAESLLENVDVTESAIVVKGHFHEGIVGIIAGKLAEKHRKPAYVFSYSEEKGIWKGSGRSYANIHLYDLTTTAAEFIAGFGGHKGAVGVGVLESNFAAFENAIKNSAKDIDSEDFIDKSLNIIDCELKEFDLDLMKLIDSYGPFGNSNKKPLFKTSGKILIDMELKGGLHYKCKIVSGGQNFVGLFFNVDKTFLDNLTDINEFTFDPVYKFDAKTKEFSVEFICNLT
jgi:single-stranded-DNA-specific exonuclease